MAAAEWSKSRNEPPRGFLGHRVRAGGGRNRDFGPDETNSNRLQDLFEVTDRAWDAEWIPGDDHLSPQGRVMEILSERTCHGGLKGYLLTGRHGFFSCYEAFIHIVDSMVNQHAKWLKSANEIEWRRPDRFAQLSLDLARLAAGSQRLQPSAAILEVGTFSTFTGCLRLL